MEQFGQDFESRETIVLQEPHSPILTSFTPEKDTPHLGQLSESAGISS
jgi:hypothetical protein